MSRSTDWAAIAKAAGRYGIRFPTNAALESFLAETASLSTAPAPGGIEAAQITMGRGLVDVTRIEHEGRAGILFRPRDQHIPIGDEGELQPGKYWPAAGDVVIWIENEGGAEVISEYLAMFLSPAATPVSAAGGDVTEAMIDAGCAAWVELYPAFEGEKPQPTAGDVVKAILIAALAKPASSPAGGDVDWKSLFETAHGALICIAEAQADAHYARKVADELTDATLSQSTSAGRVGE